MKLAMLALKTHVLFIGDVAKSRLLQQLHSQLRRGMLRTLLVRQGAGPVSEPAWWMAISYT